MIFISAGPLTVLGLPHRQRFQETDFIRRTKKMEIWKKIPGYERNSGMKFRQIASALRIDSKLALNLFHREVRV